MIRFFFIALLFLISAQGFAQTPEDCANQIDDDGDALIDCADPDCFYEAPCQTCWPQSLSPSSPSLSTGDAFGSSLEIYGDYAIIGSENDAPISSNIVSGSAAIYSWEPSLNRWNFDQQLIPGQPGSNCGLNNADFGSGVAIHKSTAAVGAPSYSSTCGSVHVFEKSPTTNQWIETQIILNPIPNGVNNSPRFGSHLAINEHWLIIGIPNYGSSNSCFAIGAIVIYKKSMETGLWQLNQTFNNNTCSDSFGTNISLSGNCFVTSGRATDPERVIVFEFDPLSESWFASSQIANPNPLTDSDFGGSLDISGTRLIVGDYRYSGNQPNEGIAYIFEKNPTTTQWELVETINNPTSSTNGFGRAVTISGNVALIGDINAEVNTVNSGTAYAFQKDPVSGAWGLNQALTPPILTPGSFAVRMFLHGRKLLAADPDADNNGLNSGSVFAFEMDETCYINTCEPVIESIECLPYTGSNTNEIILSIENNTAFEVTSIFVPPLIPGSPGTISPNVIPLDPPIQTGESTMLTLSLSNAVGNEPIDFTVALMTNDPITGDLVECCSTQVNVIPPFCGDCLLISNEAFVTSGPDLEYTFTIENLPADLINLAEHVVLAPNTSGISLSEQWFNPTGGILDGESATLTTVIENGAGLAEICLQFTIHDALLQECCGFVRCLSIPNPLIPQQPLFIRGDANGDNVFNIADTVKILSVLFQNQTADCANALDINDDEVTNIADAIYGLGVLFSGFSAPQSPFPNCGPDPTTGSLDCLDPSSCESAGTQGG